MWLEDLTPEAKKDFEESFSEWINELERTWYEEPWCLNSEEFNILNDERKLEIK